MLRNKPLISRIRNLCPWLIVFFYWANLFRMSDNSAIPYIVCTLVVGLLGLYQMLNNKDLNRNFFIVVFFIYAITSLIGILLIGNEEINDFISNLIIYGITIMMFTFPIKYHHGFISFYVTVAYFLSSFFSGALTHFVLTSSGNYISVLLILGVSLYYIGIHNSNKRISFIDMVPSVLCFMLAVWARGRGGIISTAFLLVLVIWVYIRQKQQTDKKLYKFIRFSIVLGIIILLICGISLIDEFLSLGKIGTRGFETPRPYMWVSYLYKMLESPLYVLCGAPLDEVRPIHELENNMHNSFFQLHAYNGAIVFLGFVFILFRSVVYMYRKRLMTLFIITITIIVRGMTDKFIFGQYGMPIMLYLAFYPFAYSKKKSL